MKDTAVLSILLLGKYVTHLHDLPPQKLVRHIHKKAKPDETKYVVIKN